MWKKGKPKWDWADCAWKAVFDLDIYLEDGKQIKQCKELSLGFRGGVKATGSRDVQGSHSMNTQQPLNGSRDSQIVKSH